jgi:hypothetical protein
LAIECVELVLTASTEGITAERSTGSGCKDRRDFAVPIRATSAAVAPASRRDLDHRTGQASSDRVENTHMLAEKIRRNAHGLTSSTSSGSLNAQRTGPGGP